MSKRPKLVQSSTTLMTRQQSATPITSISGHLSRSNKIAFVVFFGEQSGKLITRDCWLSYCRPAGCHQEKAQSMAETAASVEFGQALARQTCLGLSVRLGHVHDSRIPLPGICSRTRLSSGIDRFICVAIAMVVEDSRT